MHVLAAASSRKAFYVFRRPHRKDLSLRQTHAGTGVTGVRRDSEYAERVGSRRVEPGVRMDGAECRNPGVRLRKTRD